MYLVENSRSSTTSGCPNGFACQICDALGTGHGSFIKPNGERYAEAHHVIPDSEQGIGSLGASNINILCANRHRQMHHGDVRIERMPKSFGLEIDGKLLSIKPFALIT
ncbi:HNH endonuclease [Novosphingobium sp. FSW06-99]|uniref:HNH endonuclease n=1 Tax=Novosphingobium sp. FSW06-99 TaxID=1739113 RepID=UPI0009E9498A|nr:HNH endonuclease [Novosphingobium sp. FSW06-99]